MPICVPSIRYGGLWSSCKVDVRIWFITGISPVSDIFATALLGVMYVVKCGHIVRSVWRLRLGDFWSADKLAHFCMRIRKCFGLTSRCPCLKLVYWLVSSIYIFNAVSWGECGLFYPWLSLCVLTQPVARWYILRFVVHGLSKISHSGLASCDLYKRCLGWRCSFHARYVDSHWFVWFSKQSTRLLHPWFLCYLQ